MRPSKLSQRFMALVAAAVLILGVGTARAANDPAPKKLSAGAHFSFSGFGRQLGHGITNVGLCWLELPYRIKTRLTTEDQDRPTTVFTQVFDFVCGTVEGVVCTAERLSSGVIEVVVSPIPPYTPLSDPPLPPLLFSCEKQTPVSAPGVPAAPHF